MLRSISQGAYCPAVKIRGLQSFPVAARSRRRTFRSRDGVTAGGNAIPVFAVPDMHGNHQGWGRIRPSSHSLEDTVMSADWRKIISSGCRPCTTTGLRRSMANGDQSVASQTSSWLVGSSTTGSRASAARLRARVPTRVFRVNAATATAAQAVTRNGLRCGRIGWRRRSSPPSPTGQWCSPSPSGSAPIPSNNP